jgi:hypothetical protein
MHELLRYLDQWMYSDVANPFVAVWRIWITLGVFLLIGTKKDK